MAAMTEAEAAAMTEAGAPNLISREVVEIYNQLVESGRWNDDETLTNPPDFFNTLLRIYDIIMNNSKPTPVTKNDLLLNLDKFKSLADLIKSTSSNSSRKTLKRSHKSSSRKQTYKHSKKE